MRERAVQDSLATGALIKFHYSRYPSILRLKRSRCTKSTALKRKAKNNKCKTQIILEYDLLKHYFNIIGYFSNITGMITTYSYVDSPFTLFPCKSCRELMHTMVIWFAQASKIRNAFRESIFALKIVRLMFPYSFFPWWHHSGFHTKSVFRDRLNTPAGTYWQSPHTTTTNKTFSGPPAFFSPRKCWGNKETAPSNDLSAWRQTRIRSPEFTPRDCFWDQRDALTCYPTFIIWRQSIQVVPWKDAFFFISLLIFITLAHFEARLIQPFLCPCLIEILEDPLGSSHSQQNPYVD